MSESKEPDVLQYLQNINRPCGVNDIVSGLHLDSKKTSIQKILDKLVSSNKIREKVYNKSKIYCCAQPSNCDVNRIREEVNGVDAKVQKNTL